jgi:glycosyltransferase involved in cell wall biosynthesis
VLINTGHSGIDDPGYARAVHRRRLRAVYFLHDLIPITHPEYVRRGESARHERRLRTMCESGSGLIVNSAATAAVLADYARGAGWSVPPHVVALPAPAALPPSAAAPMADRPYFVILSTIEPRKNHLMLLNLWRSLASRPRPPRLVVIGQRGWECEQVVDMLERCTALRGHVIEESHCTDERLAAWLRHAQALLFPSFAEGYGLPLAEALAHGVPVIASDLPAFREIAGAIPEYLDPLDGAGWLRVIDQYADAAHPARAAQQRRMQAFRPPTWREHFAAVDEFLERAIMHGRGES